MYISEKPQSPSILHFTLQRAHSAIQNIVKRKKEKVQHSGKFPHLLASEEEQKCS